MTISKAEYIKQWLFRANEDYAVAQSLYETNVDLYASSIAFHCQQSVEKFLKSFLVYHSVHFPRTHDLDFLLMECEKINKEVWSQIELKNLSEYGVSVRYPDDFYIPDKEEIVELLEIAKVVKEKLEDLIEN